MTSKITVKGKEWGFKDAGLERGKHKSKGGRKEGGRKDGGREEGEREGGRREGG